MAFKMSQEFPTASLDITHNYYAVTELTFSYISKHLAYVDKIRPFHQSTGVLEARRQSHMLIGFTDLPTCRQLTRFTAVCIIASHWPATKHKRWTRPWLANTWPCFFFPTTPAELQKRVSRGLSSTRISLFMSSLTRPFSSTTAGHTQDRNNGVIY